MALTFSVRLGHFQKTVTAMLAVQSNNKQLQLDRQFHPHIVRAVPAFPHLHDYPYEIPVVRPVVQPRQETQRGEKQVQIRTCGKLFQKWRREKKFWMVPEEDVRFTVKYLDTGSATSADVNNPVVVVLHGSPGSHETFSQMTSHLRRDGIRVVAPCFPGLSTTMMGRFRHTPEEKCEFVKDFLCAINIPRIDMLVCHSSSVFPGLLLCRSRELSIKSLAVLNPTAFEYPRVLNPLPVVQFLARLYEFPVGKQIVNGIGKLMVKGKPELKGNKFEDHFLSAFTVVSSEPPKRASDFEELMRKNFPVLLAFSENDRLISKRALYKMAEMMVKESEIQRYDGNGKLQTERGDHPTRKVLSFKEGTHFVFQKHPQVIADEIKSFLSLASS